MSNSTPNGPQNNPREPRANDDALAALHQLQRQAEETLPDATDEPAIDDPTPAPMAEDEDNAAAEQDPSSPLSASGFVGMLARPQPQDNEPIDPTPPTNFPTQAARPMPRPLTPESDRNDDTPMEMAATPEKVPAPRPTPRVMRRRVPGWYRTMTPVMFTLSSLLMVVGVWAVLAAAGVDVPLAPTGHKELSEAEKWYMTPDEIAERSKTKTDWRLMVLITCVPVSLALGAMGVVMKKQVMIADRAAENA